MTQKPQKRVIHSIDEMNDLLYELKDRASVSIQETINAQMMVIKYVQSPSLIDTTFDSLIYSLKKSLKAAESKDMALRIQEQFSLMIQNYVFFLDARLQYSLDEHKREGQQLLREAGDMLATSVVKAAELAATGNISEIGNVIVQNVFQPSSPTEKSFFSKIVNWFIDEDNTSTQKNEFYQTLISLFDKMSRYQKVIGKSMLIAEMIKRYSPAIAQNACADEIEDVRARYADAKTKKERSMRFLAPMAFMYLAFGILMWQMVSCSTKASSIFSSEPAETATFSDWLPLILVFSAVWIFYIFDILAKRKTMSYCEDEAAEIDKKVDSYRDEINQVAQQFEENDDDLMDILK